MTTYKPALILSDTGRLAGTTEDALILRCLGLVFNQCQHHDPETICVCPWRTWVLGKAVPPDAACKILMKNRH